MGASEWLSDFTVHRRLADEYHRGRVLIAGDAAHAHAPFGGQGMLTGIGDSENLSWKLALVIRSGADPALLDTYQAERRPLATSVLRGTSTVTRVNVTGNPVGRFARDRIIVPLMNIGAIQRWVTYTTSQLWVSYRKGPLGGRGPKPRPGDRLADRPCTRPDGTSTRLYAELGRQWAVLLPDSAAPHDVSTPLPSDLVTVLGHTGPDVLLVRPDSHLAWRGSPSELDAMRHWFDAVLRTGAAPA